MDGGISLVSLVVGCFDCWLRYQPLFFCVFALSRMDKENSNRDEVNDVTMDIEAPKRMKRKRVQRSGPCNNIQSRCSPKKITTFLNSLDEQRRSALRDVGFDGLLHLASKNLSRKSINFCLSRFNPVDRVMDINGCGHPIKASDVEAILGIRNTRVGVPFSGSLDTIDSVIRNHLENGRVSMSKVEKKLREREEVDDAYKVELVLFLIGFYLCPGTTFNISKDYLLATRDVHAIQSFDWATHVLDHLCEAVHNFQVRRISAYVGGCMHLLMLFYACKVRGGGAELSRANRSTPLCADWNDTSLKSLLTERMMDEIEKGDAAAGPGQYNGEEETEEEDVQLQLAIQVFKSVEKRIENQQAKLDALHNKVSNVVEEVREMKSFVVEELRGLKSVVVELLHDRGRQSEVQHGEKNADVGAEEVEGGACKGDGKNVDSKNDPVNVQASTPMVGLSGGNDEDNLEQEPIDVSMTKEDEDVLMTNIQQVAVDILASAGVVVEDSNPDDANRGSINPINEEPVATDGVVVVESDPNQCPMNVVVSGFDGNFEDSA